MNLRIIRPLQERALKHFHGLVWPSTLREGVAESNVRRCVGGSQGQGAAEAGDRLIDHPKLGKRRTQIEMRLGIGRHECERLAEVLHRFSPAALLHEHRAQVVHREHVIRL